MVESRITLFTLLRLGCRALGHALALGSQPGATSTDAFPVNLSRPDEGVAARVITCLRRSESPADPRAARGTTLPATVFSSRLS